MSLNKELRNFFFIAIAVAMLLLMLGVVTNEYCEMWGNKYRKDSFCFDIDYRCEVECSTYDQNYTGEVKDYGCVCTNDIVVSYCSGFGYNVSDEMSNEEKIEAIRNDTS